MPPKSFSAVQIIALVVFWSFTAIGAPVEILPPGSGEAMQPQVAVAPSGSVHIVFGNGDDVFHVSSKDRGRTFAPPTKVATLPKLALGMRRGPRISATDATLVISAVSLEDGNLHAWTSADEGVNWTESGEINDATGAAREGLHAMAGNGQGLVIAVWLDLRNKETELWSATSMDGGKTWGKNVRVYQSPDGHICECCHPSVAISGEGRIAVMWRNWLSGSRDLYVATSDDGGKSFASGGKLGSGTWTLNGCPMDGGAIIYGADGEMRTVWRRESKVLASNGPGDERMLSDSGSQPIAVMSGNDVRFVWQDGKNLILQAGGSSPKRLADKASYVAGAPLPGGGAIFVWQSTANNRKTLLSEVIE